MNLHLDAIDRSILRHVQDEFPEVRQELIDTGQMSDELYEKINKVARNFKAQFTRKQ